MSGTLIIFLSGVLVGLMLGAIADAKDRDEAAAAKNAPEVKP